MAAFLPDWYQGPHFHNIEDLVQRYLRSLAPNVRVVHWLKPGWYTPGDGQGTEPTLRIWRQPGERDYQLRKDEVLIQVAAVSRSRNDSWDMIEFVGDMFEVLNKGRKLITPSGGQVTANNVEPWMGPMQVPEGAFDEFFVPMTWRMCLKGDKLIPDYRKILDSLPA